MKVFEKIVINLKKKWPIKNFLFQYCTLSDTYESAPFRAITVYDALSDLPKIKSGHATEEIRYENEPMTHFQRKVIFENKFFNF